MKKILAPNNYYSLVRQLTKKNHNWRQSWRLWAWGQYCLLEKEVSLKDNPGKKTQKVSYILKRTNSILRSGEVKDYIKACLYEKWNTNWRTREVAHYCSWKCEEFSEAQGVRGRWGGEGFETAFCMVNDMNLLTPRSLQSKRCSNSSVQ